MNESFAEDDEYDPPPAPSALVLRVPELGRSGLSNSGEPLKLRGPDGAVVSRFSGSLGVKAGMSVARRTPASPDALPEASSSPRPRLDGRTGPRDCWFRDCPAIVTIVKKNRAKRVTSHYVRARFQLEIKHRGEVARERPRSRRGSIGRLAASWSFNDGRCSREAVDRIRSRHSV